MQFHTSRIPMALAAPAEYHFAVSRARLAAHAVAIVVAAALTMVSVGVANADVCGGFGPGIVGPANCGPTNDTNTGGDGSQSDDATWPPGLDYGSDGGGGGTPASPIVPVASAP